MMKSVEWRLAPPLLFGRPGHAYILRRGKQAEFPRFHPSLLAGEFYLRPPRPRDDSRLPPRSSLSSRSGREGVLLLNRPCEFLPATGDLGRVILFEELSFPEPSLGEDSLRSPGFVDSTLPPGMRDVVCSRELDSLCRPDASGRRCPDSTCIRSWRKLLISLVRLRIPSRCLSFIRENLKGVFLLLA